jgi:hypothetical protein
MNNVEINKQAKLSQHFTLGELCKTSVKTADGNESTGSGTRQPSPDIISYSKNR